MSGLVASDELTTQELRRLNSVPTETVVRIRYQTVIQTTDLVGEDLGADHVCHVGVCLIRGQVNIDVAAARRSGQDHIQLTAGEDRDPTPSSSALAMKRKHST